MKTGWCVAEVEALPGYRLKVKHVDGTEGIVEMKGQIFSPTAGVFAALRDEALFRQVFIDMGAVTWPGELDLAPDAMHDELAAHGVWVLD